MEIRGLVFSACLASAGFVGARADEVGRKTVWDLKLGEPLAAQPSAGEYRGYACGSNGGQPRRPLGSFADFARCPAEAGGWREVYFEYDDEIEYVARARDDEQALARYAGTAERGFPLIVSALIDDDGVLRGARLATDSRPDYRKDATDADLARRADAYKFGAAMAARFDIEPNRDCVKPPRGEGENPVGALFIKLDCEKAAPTERRAYKLSVRLLRKPGQSGRDPRNPTALTKGEFESSALLEILATP